MRDLDDMDAALLAEEASSEGHLIIAAAFYA